MAASDVWVAGADGCRGGWLVAVLHPATGAVRTRRLGALADALRPPERPAVLVVDMPIGLLEAAVVGGRACDRAARQLLGAPRLSSVFSPPARPALRAATHAEASALNRASGDGAPGLAIQAFGLFPKLREVDALVTPDRQRTAPRVVEGHPEVTFAVLAGRPVAASKKTREGRDRRIALLRDAGVAAPGAHVSRHRGEAAADDVIDAIGCAWTAARVLRGDALRLPPGAAPVDGRGLRMEIWA